MKDIVQELAPLNIQLNRWSRGDHPHLRRLLMQDSLNDNEKEQVLTALDIQPTRQEAGCIKYELLQNQSEPTDFTLVEEWASNDALDTHLESAHIEAASDQLDGLVATESDIRRYILLA